MPSIIEALFFIGFLFLVTFAMIVAVILGMFLCNCVYRLVTGEWF